MPSERVRGTGSEPVEVAPGPAVREAAIEAEIEQWAWRRVKSLRLFYTHLTVYVVVNFIILLVDVSTEGDPWSYQILLGWGLVLALHAAYTYEIMPWASRDWEQRKAQELMDERRGRDLRR